MGGLYALAAFGLWGTIPLYYKMIDHVPPVEVVAHRIAWSALVLAVAVVAIRRGRRVVAALADARVRRALFVSTLLISLNWLVFIWAIFDGRLLEASLGYYINPLISVLLGVLVLRERLSLWQGLAVALAAVGVLNLAVGAADFPWVSLTLAFSFGFYGLIRKTAGVAALEGLLIETALISPLAVAFLLTLAWRGEGTFAVVDRETDLLLFLAGPVTAVPLVCFASAARRLRLSTLGFFQYLAPSCNFLLAIFVFGESFTRTHLVTFLFIWTALAIITAHGLLRGAARAVPRAL